MLVAVIICVLSLTSMCTAHLCLISPPQRGSMIGINKPGAPDCILLTAPCGGRAQQHPAIALGAGEQFVVTFQKNLDHLNKTGPGYFSIMLGATSNTMKEIYHMPDTTDPALTLYSANVTIPDTHGKMIMQAQYVTKNSQAPPAFYQCSDVEILRRPKFVKLT